MDLIHKDDQWNFFYSCTYWSNIIPKYVINCLQIFFSHFWIVYRTNMYTIHNWPWKVNRLPQMTLFFLFSQNLGQKNLGKKIHCQQIFGSFGSKKFELKFFQTNILGKTNFFGSNKFLGSKNFFGQKTFLIKKNFLV